MITDTHLSITLNLEIENLETQACGLTTSQISKLVSFISMYTLSGFYIFTPSIH